MVKDPGGSWSRMPRSRLAMSDKGLERIAPAKWRWAIQHSGAAPATYTVTVEARVSPRQRLKNVTITVARWPKCRSRCRWRNRGNCQCQFRRGTGRDAAHLDHRHDRPAPHRQSAHQRPQLHQFHTDRFAGRARQRSQHRCRADFRPQHERPACPLQPGQRGRRRRDRQFDQRRALHRFAGSGAGISDHHQQLCAGIRPRIWRRGEYHHPLGIK